MYLNFEHWDRHSISLSGSDSMKLIRNSSHYAWTVRLVIAVGYYNGRINQPMT